MRGSTVLEKYLIFTKYFGSSTSTSTSTLHFRQSSTSSTDKIVLKYKYRYLTTTLPTLHPLATHLASIWYPLGSKLSYCNVHLYHKKKTYLLFQVIVSVEKCNIYHQVLIEHTTYFYRACGSIFNRQSYQDKLWFVFR